MYLIVPSMTYRTSGYKYRDRLDASSVTINRRDNGRVTINFRGPAGGLKEAEFALPFQLLKAIYHRAEALEVEDKSTAVLGLK